MSRIVIVILWEINQCFGLERKVIPKEGVDWIHLA
jgi:hypothetical protein